MSATPAGPEPVAKITVEDLKHRAEAVKDIAVVQTKQGVAAVVEDNATRTLLIMAGVVVLAASFAFYLGSATRD